MRTRLYHTGFNLGWKLAGRYATGTKAQRAEIREKLARLSGSYSRFATGVFEGWMDLATQRAEAIKDGRSPRTVNPFKFANLLSRV